jgi:hypothetical protein
MTWDLAFSMVRNDLFFVLKAFLNKKIIFYYFYFFNMLMLKINFKK